MSIMNKAFQKGNAFQDTVSMLSELNEYELKAVQSVIRVIITKQDNYYHPLSEMELFERIDASLAQVDAGMAEDSEIAEREIMAELGL